MAVHNQDIADKFNEVADLLEIEGENPFRIRSYQNAARTIGDMSENISDLIERGEDISDYPDIGESIAEKVEEIVKTGKLKQLEELKKKVPVDVGELIKIPQLGGKRIAKLYNELEVKDLNSLKKAAEQDKISDLEGLGAKTQQKILREIKKLKQNDAAERFRLDKAEEILEPLINYLRKFKSVKKIDVAGSYRRRKETVGDIDILLASSKNEELMNYFVDYEEVEEVIAKGKTKSSVILKRGLQVDVRVIPQVSYGAAFLYFTGSKEHNVELRKIAQGKDYKINEYGLYDGDERIAGKTESEIYKELGLKYIEPELRENRNEIEASKDGQLPDLIKLSDIKGDLQTHSKYSDGKYSIEEMVKAAKKMGYEYYAVTDHSKRVTMANGLDKKRLRKEIEEIDKLNDQISGIKILKSIEVDILADGSLDLPDEVLKELDLVICSIHYNRNLSRTKQTKRVLKAMENPHFNIFAHPTGRQINERAPYDIDIEKIIREAKKNKCYLEMNANPERLDLSDTNAKMARDYGVKLSISTDAHSVDNLKNIKYGVYQARRAWLEASDVLNTHTWTELKKLLKR
jgi:DNA polymerase (family 10)